MYEFYLPPVAVTGIEKLFFIFQPLSFRLIDNKQVRLKGTEGRFSVYSTPTT